MSKGSEDCSPLRKISLYHEAKWFNPRKERTVRARVLQRFPGERRRSGGVEMWLGWPHRFSQILVAKGAKREDSSRIEVELKLHKGNGGIEDNTNGERDNERVDPFVHLITRESKKKKEVSGHDS